MAAADTATGGPQDQVSPAPPTLRPDTVPPSARLKVIVVWDGANRLPYPPDMLLPPGSLITLPPESLKGYHGPDNRHDDRLLDDIFGWATSGPTLIAPWRGLPATTVRLLAKVGRLIGRDRVVSLPAAPTPLTALAVGWRTAMLVAHQPVDVPEARALAGLVAAETRSVAVLPRPHRSRLVDLSGFDVARSVRPGTKVIRFGRRASLARLTSETPLLDGASDGPRLIFVARVDDHESRDRVELGLTAADTAVEMAPGSLDREAWGQRGYTEITFSPRDIGHLLPSVTGLRLCHGCEQLTTAGQAPCPRCSFHH